MLTTIKKMATIVITSISIIGCTKNQDTILAPLTATVVKDLAADTVLGIASNGMPYSAGKYTFYSLEKNAIVPNTDSASTKWDIALYSTKILTNAGTSGTGMGGAFVYTGLFDDLKTIPTDSVFKTDNAPASYAVPYGSGKGWYTYDQATSLVTPLAGRVLVIRTASGKYAKIEIMNYYKGGVTLPLTASAADKLSKQRYYTFRFIFQSNGSKTF